MAIILRLNNLRIFGQVQLRRYNDDLLFQKYAKYEVWGLTEPFHDNPIPAHISLPIHCNCTVTGGRRYKCYSALR
jgi:hypothetical protein